MSGFAKAGRGFHPAERLLDALADDLAWSYDRTWVMTV
jgi:hypothetical protein